MKNVGFRRAAARSTRVLAVTGLLALGVAACGDDDSSESDGASADAQRASECAATIGLMAPVTGEVAEIGEEQVNWATIALDRFNREKGTDIRLEEGDTQLDPAQASTVAQQFASDDEIVAVVGPAGSQEVEAVGPIFERAGLAFVSGSATSAALTEEGKYPTFSRVVPRDSAQGPTDAEYIAERLGAKHVLIVDDQTSYSTGLAESAGQELEAAGVKVSRESVRQDQTDFSALASSVAGDVDVVFLPWQVAANGQLFGRQLEEQGKDVQIFGSDGLFVPGEFSIEGAYVSAFAPDITAIETNADLVEEYRADYDKQIGTQGPPTHAALTVVAGAVQRACKDGDPTREAVAEEIRATDLPDSILGQPIRFDENGDIDDARFFIFEVNGKGEFELAPDA
jgi:branched-chain amino acid transport system substrate-binding protein